MNPFAGMTMDEVEAHNAKVHAGQMPLAPPPPFLGVAKGNRVRQSSKPLMNKLESDCFAMLAATGLFDRLRAQAKRFRLGNGIWFKVDITGIDTRDGRDTAWEVKGPHAWQSGIQPLKVAAGLYPEIRWLLIWKGEKGAWKQQEILP